MYRRIPFSIFQHGARTGVRRMVRSQMMLDRPPLRNHGYEAPIADYKILGCREFFSWGSQALEGIHQKEKDSIVEEHLDPFSLVADELSVLGNRLREMVVAEGVPKLGFAAEYFFKMGVEGKRFRPTGDHIGRELLGLMAMRAAGRFTSSSFHISLVTLRGSLVCFEIAAYQHGCSGGEGAVLLRRRCMPSAPRMESLTSMLSVVSSSSQWPFGCTNSLFIYFLLQKAAAY